MGIPGRPLTGGDAFQGDIPNGWVRMYAADHRDTAILTAMGPTAPVVTQGYGGWQEVERRGRVAITHWTGFQPVGLEFELWLDDFNDNHSVERPIKILEALAGRGTYRISSGQPPRLKVNSGGVIPHDAHSDPGLDWVVQDLSEQADQTIRNESGNAVRAMFTVNLLQYVNDDRLRDRSLAARQKLQKAGTKRSRKRYHVKKGDTLISIARRQLGDPGRWREIATLNKLRDPRGVKPGAYIRLP